MRKSCPDHGPTEALVASNAEAGVYDVPTTGEFVRVFVQLVDGRWLVTDVQPTA